VLLYRTASEWWVETAPGLGVPVKPKESLRTRQELTGTGIVPPDSFTLADGDRVDISIDGIGTLVNTVEQAQ
jgi:hypothetical protein